MLQEVVLGVRHAKERLDRIEGAMPEFVPSCSLSPIVEAMQALRGMNLISAVTSVVEIGDLRRFDKPRQLMGYLGLVLSERSKGDRVRRGSITKPGTGRVSRTLVESAWTYRYPPRVGKMKLHQLERVSLSIRDIACKALDGEGSHRRP